MRNDPNKPIKKGMETDIALSIKKAVGEISSRVRKKYSFIQPETIPDHVNYAKIEKYLRSVNVEVTRKMFVSYIKQQLLPGGQDIRNANFSLYTHEQILYYILVDMFKPILPLGKIKVLFQDVLRPMIYLIGLDTTYVRLCENILSKLDGFESAVALAVEDDMKMISNLVNQPENIEDAVVQTIGSIAYYTQVESLCLAKGAQDFSELTPGSPLQ